MKKMLLLLICLLLLTGCSLSGSDGDHVTFYYPRVTPDYEQESALIAYEQQDASGHTDDIGYLLSMYLRGPLDEELVCPFPQHTTLHTIWANSETLTIEISDTARSLTDARFSLACSCLTMTCKELTGVQTVTIRSGDRSFTSDGSDLLLADNYYFPADSGNGGTE